MKISSLFQDRTVFSFEVFPPKRDMPIESIYSTLDALQDIRPDFISVTLGAGGSGNGGNTVAIARKLKEEYGILPMAHLPCVNFTKAQVDGILQEFQENDIDNILALRGDYIPNVEPVKDFLHASDLVSYIQSKGNFDIGAGCYPECHPEARNFDTDIANLKKKVDAGASHLISQLFFDNDMFYDFRYKCTVAGIHVPIEAGIMPVTNRKQIERMVSMCGASLPRKFIKLVHRYENNPEALRDAGIAYAVDQIVDLVTNGVDGIHLYTMNNPYVAKKINDAVRSIIQATPPCHF